MKRLRVLSVILFFYFTLSGQQIDRRLSLPAVSNIKEITVTPSPFDWYTPESLLKTLPRLRVGGRYQTKMLWQDGTIVLKDGLVLYWRAKDNKSLVLYTNTNTTGGGGERYFVVPRNR